MVSRRSGLYNGAMDSVSPSRPAADSPGAVRSGLHILLLDPVFRLPNQPEHTRSFDLAQRLVAAGHRVSVITTTAALSDQRPQLQGITVAAVPSRERARLGYALGPMAERSFALGSLLRLVRTHEVDAAVVATTSSFVLATATLFSWVRGIPMVLDVRATPERTPATAPFGAKAHALWRRVVSRVAGRRAVHVFATSLEVREGLISIGLRAEKIITSPLGSDGGAHKDAAMPLTPPGGGRVVLYAGPLAPGHGLEEIIALAQVMRDRQGDGIRFVISGDGPERRRLEALALQADVLDKTLWFHDPLTHGDRVGAFSAATAVIVATEHRTADGSAGLYDALAAGKPLLLMGNGAHRDLIEARGAGIGLPPCGSPENAAAAAREIADFLGDADGLRRAGQQAAALATGRFNRERILGELRQRLEDAVAAEPRAVVMRRRLLAAKRAIDVLVSGAALIVLSPVLLGIAIAVWATMGWPPVFSQMRPGQHGTLFRIYKFRTMTNAKDASGALLPDAQRLTRFGTFLRRSSLDELPELINVLKGDMSLVGPRPLLPEYLAHYSAEQRRRHELRPGITGWSQVRGRNALSWEEKFALDVWYVDHVSLWLDAKILLLTVWTTLARRGISAPGHATMPRFDEIMARREGAEDI